MNDRPIDPSGDDLLGQTSIEPAIGEILARIQEHAVWTPKAAEKASHVAGAVLTASDTRVTIVGRPTPATRSEKMIAWMLSSRFAKVAAAALLVVFATGGMAYAGVLPDPIQGAVTDLAQVLGIEIEDDDVSEESATADDDVIETGTESDEDDDTDADDAVVIVDDEDDDVSDDSSDEADDDDDDETEDDESDEGSDDDESEEDDDSDDDSDDDDSDD